MKPIYEKFKTAQEYWDNPPVKIGETLQGFRDRISHKTEHADYMDFCEIYADYVCSYEKNFDRGGKTRLVIENYENMSPAEKRKAREALKAKS